MFLVKLEILLIIKNKCIMTLLLMLIGWGYGKVRYCYKTLYGILSRWIPLDWQKHQRIMIWTRRMERILKTF